MPPPGPGPARNLSLSITNPLVLYRALVATKKIRPDPAQHRLALQLQKLYYRLKDYAPEVEYRYRLERIARRTAVARNNDESERHGAEQRTLKPSNGHKSSAKKGFGISSLLNVAPSNTLALTRTEPLHSSAVAIPSPQGMLLYGEVGRGKSMLLDLLYTSLPSRKKRRWHFNTFMLDLYRRIEQSRRERLELEQVSSRGGRPWLLFGKDSGVNDNEHVILSLAKDTIGDSPILFLDEFQMPDRTASKLINSFFTGFFHLGGVLVASSNRMPDELSKAAGIDFGRSASNGWGTRGGLWGLGWGARRSSQAELQAKGDFGLFLEVLKARCEVWEMEGERDWRRDDGVEGLETREEDDHHPESEAVSASCEDDPSVESPHDTGDQVSSTTTTALADDVQTSADAPPHYHVSVESTNASPSFLQRDILTLNPSDTWTPSTLTVYARRLSLPQTHQGILKATFSELCATYLGPADYVSLCSTFHTLILLDVPVLTLLQKNEARRFITLLDALYEARCRLLIEAEAPPDKLFFPETRSRLNSTDGAGSGQPNLLPLDQDLEQEDSDSITSESFSEMYQDSVAPFRANVAIYTDSNTATSVPWHQPAFTPSIISPSLRSVLADEDADFGPTYGNGRSQGMSSGRVNLDVDGPQGMAELELRQGPDFTQTGAMTGEDERFAFKRARSRLWEMCGKKWWDQRAESQVGVNDWWRPIDREGRAWEQFDKLQGVSAQEIIDAAGVGGGGGADEDVDHHADTQQRGQISGVQDRDDTLFKHGASPFRVSEQPPPKFGWQHAWGMMQWGTKAGEWGKGVEGDKVKDRVDNDDGVERNGPGGHDVQKNQDEEEKTTSK
ncbi:hypothetical protein PV10_08574 [Exophiala mesophila]|uniref:AAA+ ATPase domain-containing protein n=1 Tax=Exophiala mesophila TaxID=212818 RepID=A0A0D1Z4W2_EXOME|nr:uncharacterized protein PV10_08574 [Exophiala mesophila]KIV88949.1 hypothetical protein PV10_08574 [Exophiala mesophila]